MLPAVLAVGSAATLSPRASVRTVAIELFDLILPPTSTDSMWSCIAWSLNECSSRACSLEEHAHAERCLQIVLQPIHGEDVAAKCQVLHIDVQRQPVRWQYPKACAEVHRKILVAGEFDAPDAADQIQRAGHRHVMADEDLAGQHVVTQRKVVIREAPLSTGKKLDTAAEQLEAGLAGGGAAVGGLEKEVLG